MLYVTMKWLNLDNAKPIDDEAIDLDDVAPFKDLRIITDWKTDPTVAFALSGGGIRSASFASGVLRQYITRCVFCRRVLNSSAFVFHIQ